MFKKIKTEMATFPITTELKMPVEEIHMYMNERGIRHLPVVDDNERLIGVVSERDVLAAKGKGLLAEDVMSTNPFIVDEDANLCTVVENMADYKYGSVLIVDSENTLKGIFTTIDALRLLTRFLDSEPDADWVPDNIVLLKDIVGYSQY
ncbi:MAG: CBS domain-containing protein [Bdellovibrionales bacterium]